MSNSFTSYIDTAQVTLYAFWIFFAGLVWWLRKEDRREGYPVEEDNPKRVYLKSNILIPKPKTFVLPHGGGTIQAPNFARDTRPMNLTRAAHATGSAADPVGDPLLSCVGPATWAERHAEPEMMVDGRVAIVPMRADDGYSIMAGPDCRGWVVIAGDKKVAGKVKDIWVDRADQLVRYLEVELGDGATRMVPMPMSRVLNEEERVEVYAIESEQFDKVPQLAKPDEITILEEEKISAYFAAGRLYANPKRLGPVL